ncbi:MAG: rane protein [Rhizobacter sp.]|nr:rane protein [Rhizobacter sp.]
MQYEADGVVSPVADAAPPGIWRRLACFTYEGVLLFGVLMISGYLFSSLTQQRNAMIGRHELQAFLFVVLGIYFVWFWSRGGQTVAMKTWNIRLVSAAGAPVSQARALARYVLSWLWFLPALASVWMSGAKSLGVIFGSMIAGVAVYAMIARFHPSRQFLHDIVAGTRLVTWKPRLREKTRKTGVRVESTKP